MVMENKNENEVEIRKLRKELKVLEEKLTSGKDLIMQITFGKYKCTFFSRRREGIFLWKDLEESIKKYSNEILNDETSFKLILPVQKEFSSYLSFTKVTKLYGIQVPTIQDLKQFEPGTYSWNPEDICDKMVVTLKPQNFGGTGSANEPTIAEFVSAVMHNIIGSLNGSNLQFNYNDSLSGEYFDYVYGIVTTGIQWVFLIFSSKFKAAASTRNILQLNISSENVNEEQLAMDLKKIFSVILWMLDDRIHSIGSSLMIF
ncbi:1525_t:CDS:2 [Entrophospora sp. SA101]|nr:1508_t:CDS:2 [Entrophospora sp. SA101]CAJ0923045.1 1517_t:CDS:2 [Entrophospora sp. SA101]CAJ0923065.1 1525_t:CDS:2 [Entrophospora sp. SA101]